MSTPGYSGKPVWEKMGLKAGMRVVLLDAPDDVRALVGAAPGILMAPKPEETAHAWIACVTSRNALTGIAKLLTTHVGNDAMVWICWPKKSSGIRTDIHEQTLRDELLPTGLVDVKVCAVTETWSGLKFVWRKELR